MPPARSVLLVVPAAHKDNASAVFEAWGRGPNTFSVPASPTGNNPPTHYFAHDGSMTEAIANTTGAMPDSAGTLPDISPNEWGENGVIIQGLAKAACAAMHISVATNIEGSDHRDGILAGLSLQEIQLEI